MQQLRFTIGTSTSANVSIFILGGAETGVTGTNVSSSAVSSSSNSSSRNESTYLDTEPFTNGIFSPKPVSETFNALEYL